MYYPCTCTQRRVCLYIYIYYMWIGNNIFATINLVRTAVLHKTSADHWEWKKNLKKCSLDRLEIIRGSVVRITKKKKIKEKKGKFEVGTTNIYRMINYYYFNNTFARPTHYLCYYLFHSSQRKYTNPLEFDHGLNLILIFF